MKRSHHARLDRSFAPSRKAFRLQEVIAGVARALWPRGTAAELAWRTATRQRTAEYWLAEMTAPSGEHLAGLLRSEAGYDFLCAIMEDAPASWWPALKTRVELARLDRRSLETRRAIRTLSQQLEAQEMRQCLTGSTGNGNYRLN